jgi:hypothetical protein
MVSKGLIFVSFRGDALPQRAGRRQNRHCERSEAIHSSAQKEEWIASSLSLLAMTVPNHKRTSAIPRRLAPERWVSASETLRRQMPANRLSASPGWKTTAAGRIFGYGRSGKMGRGFEVTVR